MAILVAALSLAAAACEQKAAPGANAPGAAAKPRLTPPGVAEPVANATINEIMKLQAEPAADAIWGSVKTVSDASGVHEFKPANDAEWAAVAQSARVLIGVAEMIAEPDRRLLRPGAVMEEGGTLTPEALQTKINTNRPEFVAKAKALDAAARVVLAAAEAQDAEKLLDEGGPLYDACEACHTQFYYPQGAAQ